MLAADHCRRPQLSVGHAARVPPRKTASFGPGASGAERPRAFPCCAGGKVLDVERTSLVAETLEEMATDEDSKKLAQQLQARGQAALTREERRARQRSLESLGAPAFQSLLQDHGVSPMLRGQAKILQLNIGLYCNQACSHCHVESSPLRKEMMDRETAQRCLHLAQEAASNGALTTLDITGGAPELNSQFRYLASGARAMGLEVIDRCNLTVLLEPGQEDLVPFLAEQGIRVVASLPCYTPDNVDQQRGRGVFERSIEGLKMLNAAGYGKEGSGLQLDLVYNPNGIFLAPPQAKLQEAYKQELQDLFGISFNRLFCLNNMPIKRYADYLLRQGQLGEYLQLLVQNFNAAAAEGVMCRDTVNVSWDGRVYDCDFNQQLEMGIRLPGKPVNSLIL
ncbi:hypothetical protein WJX84_008165 [Apatococcus fuscideae]|uniref:Fe-S oxidoreductase n=1 Tax=Apatococcus fuscideae TaxID=2026836 RepID=A0AAW1TB75_9CHLO